MEEIKHFTSTPQSLLFDIEIRHIPIKRFFDVIFSAACLLIGTPFLFLISILIFITSPGTVIYSQERIGRGGKPFRCYKFRSMYPNADQRLQELLRRDPTLKKEWEQSYKLKNDPRITPLGLFLRKTSLDELPQFWNVLKGDLSVVGPRPVVKEEIDKFYSMKAYKILSIRPGLTGPWQVSGRSDIQSYEHRIGLDEYYIDNQSFLLDLKLIVKTVPAMLSAKGAY